MLTKIPNFRRCVIQSFPFIEEDFDALTDYQLLSKVVEYLNKVIDSTNEQNTVIEEYVQAFNELNSYVEHYFDNLDVQEEINNKLDIMAQTGQLGQILETYIQPELGAIQNSITDLASSTTTSINNLSTTLTGDIESVNNSLQSQITAIGSGSPIPVASTSSMTDTTRTYVNTTNGKWYYYDGDSWEIGGDFQSSSISTDPTLKSSGSPADALAVGNYARFDHETVKELGQTYNFSLDLDKFELGNIDVTQNPPTYGYSSIRIRTKETASFHLEAGDTIVCNSNLYYWYCYWVDSEEEIGSINRRTSNYTCTTTGEYHFVIYKVDSSAPFTSITEYANVLSIRKRSYDAISIREKQNTLLFDNVHDKMELGGITISNGKPPAYSSSTSRMRLLRDVTLSLTEGDIIYINDPNLRMYLGYYYNGAWATPGSWISDKYVCPKTGEYVFVVRYATEATITTFKDIVKAIVIAHQHNLQTEEQVINYLPINEYFVKAINHRGYSRLYPENTLPAFKASARLGFKAVETDVRETSDGVMVCLHDESINRTARTSEGEALGSTVNIADITYEQALTYDFGVYKDPKYAGTKIPTFEELVKLCKQLSLELYIEIKINDVQKIINMIKSYDMMKHVTFISFSKNYLSQVVTLEETARVGLLKSRWETDTITDCVSLKTGKNEVFLDAQATVDVSDHVADLISNGIKLEIYTPNVYSEIADMNPYISGVTSDWLNAGRIYKEKNIN